MSPWLTMRAAPNGAVVRLLCLHRAGGTAQDFAEWPDRICRDIHVCPVQLPGRLERFTEPVMDRMGPLAREVAGVAAELAGLPLVLFGECMGALLAFEVARELRRVGARPPASLIVASYPPPDHPRTVPCYHDAPSQAFKDHLAAIGGVSEGALDNEEFFELMLPMLRADFAVFETYRYVPEPPLVSEIHAIGGGDDRNVSEPLLEGWRHHTSGTFSRRMFPGDHSFVQMNPEVPAHVERLVLRHAARRRSHGATGSGEPS
ncbi:MAG: thioesterase domain-containing protein [Isosphaeraceae bacterium]|nr:thioesterase domain-containing protein [Isosphaeraceae bacterium]